jgi:phenylalanyl-tRNA synthetase beta chain
MNVLWSWLKDYLGDTSITPEKAAQLLTQAGTETEIKEGNQWAESFCVTYIEKACPHPNADHLWVCKVKDRDNKEHTVVCGGTNVRQGLKTILVLPGHNLPGEKKPLELCTIRGIRSEGMLCSAQEICAEDLWHCPKGHIMELPEDIPNGTSLKSLLPDETLLIADITANRGDLFSHIGIARELKAIMRKKSNSLIAHSSIAFFPHNLKMTEVKDSPALSVSIQDVNACPQFYLAAMQNICAQPTPALMRRRLASLGLRLHFSCVDMTNYFVQDIGRPLHAFDAQEIEGHLSVRFSKEGEIFHSLDDQSYVLPNGLLVVSDEKGILSLAGIMGGARASCKPKSTHILLESAQFHPSLIARAGQITGIISESRMRFERGVDPLLVRHGFDMALHWIVRHCFGKITQVARHQVPYEPRSIFFDLNQIKTLGGSDLSVSESQDRLQILGAKVVTIDEDDTAYEFHKNKIWNKYDGCAHNLNKHSTIVYPPSWRNDWQLPEDCVEEILRLDGYQCVPSLPLPVVVSQHLRRFQDQKYVGSYFPKLDNTALWKGRKFLACKGFYEVVTWSFLSEFQAKLFSKNAVIDNLILSNPISKDMMVMRPSLIPSLISIYTYHNNHALLCAPMFECGPRFLDLDIQEECLSGLVPEKREDSLPRLTFFNVKDIVETLLHALNVSEWQCEPSGPEWYHPGQCLQIMQKDNVIATLGKLHPKLSCEAFAFEINFSKLMYQEPQRNYTIPSLQPVTKDLSFFIPKDHYIGWFIKELEKTGQPELIHIFPLEIFHSTERSVTLRCVFQPTERTFSDAQLHQLMNNLIVHAEKIGASLRGIWKNE